MWKARLCVHAWHRVWATIVCKLYTFISLYFSILFLSDLNTDGFNLPTMPSALEQIQSYDIISDDDLHLEEETHLSEDEAHYLSNNVNPSAMEEHVSDGSAISPTDAEAQVSPAATASTSQPSTSQPLTHQIGNQSKSVFQKE